MKTNDTPKVVKYYTLDEVADMFSVHRDTIKREVKDGNIEGLKIRNTYRIPDYAVEAYRKSMLVSA